MNDFLDETPFVGTERTGWRDEALSRRHRMYGLNCPAVDIDFLMLEYDSGMPKALIEYKHEFAEETSLTHASYRALRHLAVMGRIPFFVVRYTYEWRYTVIPACNLAETYVPVRVEMAEDEYVELLYAVRGRVMPEDVRRWIGKTA